MSHNQLHYRRKITSKTADNCKKIDILFKQKSLQTKQNLENPGIHPTTSSLEPQKSSDVPSSYSQKRKASRSEAVSSFDSDGESDIVHVDKKRHALVPDNRLFDTTRYELKDVSLRCFNS